MPITWSENVSAPARSSAANVAAPTPARLTVCTPALSVSVIVPVRFPTAVGVNVTPNEQPEFALMVPVQLLLTVAKSPVWPKVKPVTAEAVVFETLTDCGVLVLLVAVEANARLEGDNVTVGVVRTPVPVTLTVCGLPLASSVKTTVPARVPVVVGVKTMVSVQLWFG